jgi:hypothetical protein
MSYTQKITALLLSFLLVAVAGCTANKYTEIEKYSTDSSADFGTLKTYRWDFSAMGKIQPEGGHLPEFDRVLCDHVDKHLQELGFTRVNQGPVDFSLDYRTVITRQEAAIDGAMPTENDEKANNFGWKWRFGNDKGAESQGMQAPKDEMVAYRKGTLHLGAFDSKGQNIWHSSATRILNEHGNEAERRAALRIAVNKLMATFPAKK